jgi:butyryl-CoA dehydrogenase
MDFDLTMKQAVTRRTVRSFAEEELGPIAASIDEEARFPWEVVEKMKALQYFGLQVPKEYGGAGLDTISGCIVIEELSRVCAAIGLAIAVHNGVAAYPITVFGTDAQKKRFLPPLAKGEKIGAFCLTEPNAGSDPTNVETTAIEDGGELVLNGHKIFVTNGEVAGVALIFATTDPQNRKKGMGVVIVEANRPGFSLGEKEDHCGMRANPVGSLIMEDCRVPRDCLLGKPGDGYRIGLQTLDNGRIGIAAQAVGIAQACLEASVKYAKERRQFDRPIGQFQAIQNFLADMATEVEAARLLTYRAAHRKDKRHAYSQEAAMSKVFASETAMRSAIKGVQIHGGYGYTKAYPIERYYRDAKATEIYEGTSEIQRLVIAREMLR